MRWGRAYFGFQALAGAAWWIAVFASPFVRTLTLGSLDPIAVAVVDVPLFVVASALTACGVRSAALVAASWTGAVAVALAVYATATTEAGWGVLLMGAAAGSSAIALCSVLLGRVPTEWAVRGPFAFRPAAIGSSPAKHVVATFGQIVVFWGLFLVAIPLVVTAVERRWDMALAFPTFAAQIGAAILILASALGIASAVAMSTRGAGTPLPSAMANRLVVAGPYRWVRNPMAIAGIVQGVAVGLMLSSWLVIVYAITGSLLWNYVIRPLEEADLNERFGDDFQRYCATVRCWIPLLPARS
jgi:protein-S-isoprenylcysteine O-methyltransferase Ste14